VIQKNELSSGFINAENVKEEGYYWVTTKRSPRGVCSGYRTICRIYTYDRRWYVQFFGDDRFSQSRLDEIKDIRGPIVEQE